VSATIVSVRVSDPAPAWKDLGFAVEDGTTTVGSIRFELGAEDGDAGVLSWRLFSPMAGEAGQRLVDGLPTELVDDPGAAGPAPPHPNGAVVLDHLVVRTPDFARTLAALGALGLEPRRLRPPDQVRPVEMAFFRLGEAILEVVGPTEAPAGAEGEPARFSGLAFTVADLEASATLLGDRLGRPRDAVQPGRRIATVDRGAGARAPIAFLTVDPRQAGRAGGR